MDVDAIGLVEREMTDAEFARMNAGFDEHTREHGNPLETSDRYGFVALDGDAFIGCASGLTYKNGETYNGWFYLTDLFVEKPYRGRGLGAALLQRLEDRVAALGVTNFWTVTAGYEAPGFYQKQGYVILFEQENWYATGHSRVTLRKTLRAENSENEISAAASCGVSERSRWQAPAGGWPLRRPLGSDKQGYGASSGASHPEGVNHDENDSCCYSGAPRCASTIRRSGRSQASCAPRAHSRDASGRGSPWQHRAESRSGAFSNSRYVMTPCSRAKAVRQRR